MPTDAKDLIGKRCKVTYQGKRYAAVIVDAKPNGFAEPGHIPDMLITVRGPKRTVTLSMVESYLSITEDT